MFLFFKGENCNLERLSCLKYQCIKMQVVEKSIIFILMRKDGLFIKL